MTEQHPDWADIREMARKAGFKRDLYRDGYLGNLWLLKGRPIIDDDLREYVTTEYWGPDDRLYVRLFGPQTANVGPRRTAALVNPTPAEFLEAAKLVKLGSTA